MAMIAVMSAKANADESIWQTANWSNGKPTHTLQGGSEEYHTPIYNESHVTYSQLNPENAKFHRATATCATCHATATLDTTFMHTYNNSQATCDGCGYHPQFYVKVYNKLAAGVETPSGFEAEYKLAPFDRGSTYTAYAKSYERHTAQILLQQMQ